MGLECQTNHDSRDDCKDCITECLQSLPTKHNLPRHYRCAELASGEPLGSGISLNVTCSTEKMASSEQYAGRHPVFEFPAAAQVPTRFPDAAARVLQVLRQLAGRYEEMVVKDPELTSKIESALRVASYLIPGARQVDFGTIPLMLSIVMNLQMLIIFPPSLSNRTIGWRLGSIGTE